MKLTLPLALLGSLLACCGSIAQADAVYGTVENNGGAVVSAYTDSNFYNITGEVIINESFAYDLTTNPSGTPNTVMSIAYDGQGGKLSILTPEDATEGTVVSTPANLFVGGRGYNTPLGQCDSQHGEVYVGKGSTLIVGDKGTNSSNTQLNLGMHGAGGTGKMVVDGGTAITACLNVALSWDTSGDLQVINGGKMIVRQAANMSSASIYIGGYAGSTGTTTIDTGSTLQVYAEARKDGSVPTVWTYVGMGYDGTVSGTLNVQGKSTATLDGLFIGYLYTSTGKLTVNDSVLTANDAYLGFDGEGTNGTLDVTNGGSATLLSAVLGYGAGTSGYITVSGSDSKLTVTNALDIGYEGKGEVTISKGALATVGNEESVSSIASTGKLTVTDASLKVSGTLINDGILDVNLSNGGSFEVSNLINAGTSTIKAAAETVCHFGNVTLEEGSTMKLAGAGDFSIGSADSGTEGGDAPMTIFSVSGASETTHIDFTGMGDVKLTVEETAWFTLDFEPYVANMAAGTSESFTLTLISGSAGLTVEGFDSLLERTKYLYGNEAAAQAMTYALTTAEADGIELDYAVSNATYELVTHEDGSKDLVWTGTLTATDPNAVPEPATATLSLLALAGLVTRRRRK